MRVMTWNTLFGGWDEGDDRRSHTQAAVIAEVRPDVLLLQECKGFEANGGRRLFDAERRLGMRGLLAIATNTGQHTAVFFGPSVVPVSFSQDGQHFHHAAAQATFDVPEWGEAITFVSVHLCPFGPAVRLREATYLTDHAAPHRLTLVAGDFNSLSPHDPEPVGWDALPPHQRARYFSNADGSADRETLRQLGRAGFADVAVRLGCNGETTVPAAGFKGAEFVPFRCDYVLASERLAARARSYAVLKDDRTAIASDHYPVVVDFQ